MLARQDYPGETYRARGLNKTWVIVGVVVIAVPAAPVSSAQGCEAKLRSIADNSAELERAIAAGDRVLLLITGHEHLFEHWVERYVDARGTPRRSGHTRHAPDIPRWEIIVPCAKSHSRYLPRRRSRSRPRYKM